MAGYLANRIPLFRYLTFFISVFLLKLLYKPS